MVWKLKSKDKEEVPEEIEEIDVGQEFDFEKEANDLKAKQEALEKKKKELEDSIKKSPPAIKPKSEGIEKQELIDMALGNLQRSAQILEALRRI
jgi:hypothetical protein